MHNEKHRASGALSQGAMVETGPERLLRQAQDKI